MREIGLPKVLTWRWTPCAALTLGAASFAAFALLVIPDRIGELGAATQSAAARLTSGNSFASTQSNPSPGSNWSTTNNAASPSPPPPNTVSHVSAARPNDVFPKRGFSPPLERPEPPPTPVPTPPPAVNLQMPTAAPQTVAEPVPPPPPAPVAEPQASPPAEAPAPPPAPAEAPQAAPEPSVRD